MATPSEAARELLKQEETPQAASIASPTVTLREPESLAAARVDLAEARSAATRDRLSQAADILKGLIERLTPRASATSFSHQSRDEISTARLLAASLVTLGDVEMRDGRSSDARRSFEQAVAIIETVPATDMGPLDLSERGIALVGVGRATEALPILQEAVSLGADGPWTYRYLAAGQLAVGNLADAEASIRHALVADPVDPQLFSDLAVIVAATPARQTDAALLYCDAGEAHERAGRLDAAMGSFDRALSLDPSRGRAWIGKANGLRLLGRPDEAIAALDQATKFAPDDRNVLPIRAAILAESGRLQDSLNLIEAGAQSSPDNEELEDIRAFVLLKMGRVADATATVDRLLATFGPTAHRLTIKGVLLAREQRLAESVDVLTQAVNNSPEVWGYVQLGESLRLLGRYNEALTALDEALKIGPNDPWTLGTKGQVLRKLGLNEEAAEALQRALKGDPDLGWARAELGECLRLLARYDEALTALDQVLAAVPDDPWTLGTKGQVLRAQGRAEQAAEVLGQAVAGNPDLIWAQRELCECLRLLGRDDEAAAAVDQALARFPDDPWLLTTKGEVLVNQGHNEEAATVLEKALGGLPGLETAERALTAAFESMGRYDDEIAVLERVLDRDPQAKWAILAKVSALLAGGHAEEALAAIDDALVHDGSSDFEAMRGEALRLLDREAEALDALDVAIHLDPNHAFALASKAAVLQAAGRHDEALQVVSQALTVAPSYSWALACRASILGDVGQYNEALEAVDQALQLGEASSWVLGLKAWVLERLSLPAQAVDAFRAALALDPDALHLHAGLGDALLRLERPAEANEEYDWVVSYADTHAQELKADGHATTGWARYRLGNFGDAVRSYTEALSLDPRLVWARFDVGLVLLCAGKRDLSTESYRRAVDEAETFSPGRQFGLIRVAHSDLVEARQWHPDIDGDATQTIEKLLVDRLRALEASK